MKIKPLVSVIITTCNRANLLTRAIDSVLSQTYKNIEIIIADDASTDRTEEVVNNYKKQFDNIIYIKHEKSMGANVGRNNAIKASRGEFVAGIDDDDEFTKNRIELLITNYKNSFSFITTKNIFKFSHKTKYQKGKSIISLDDILYENYIGNQVLVEKQRLYDVELYDEKLTASQDYDMWVRLISKFGDAKSLDDHTQILYCNHNQNRISNTGSRKKFKGYFNFYRKYKYLMNRNQRKSQLTIIRISIDKKISFKTYCTLLNTRHIKRLTINFITTLIVKIK